MQILPAVENLPVVKAEPSGTFCRNLQHAGFLLGFGISMTATSPITRRIAAGGARTGILLMLAGMLMFSLNDAMGKMLVSTYSIGQVLLIRSVAALIVLAPFLYRQGRAHILEVERPWLQLFRVFLSTFEVFCFYFAVSYYPLADVMTFWLACPIYVAALAPFLLGEHVGWRRWSAIVIGFIGVVIALQPAGREFGAATIVSIIGPVAFAAFIVSGRSLRATPDTTLVFWQIIAALVAGIVLSPFHWVTPSLTDVCLLGLLGVVAMAAHMLVNRALKLADASTLAPLQYTLLFWAVIFGFIFFGDAPNVSVYVGAALIVAAGIFIVLRERALNKKRADAVTEPG
jgi:drug/metabolite transporter (DMT)-like permease